MSIPFRIQDNVVTVLVLSEEAYSKYGLID